MYRTFSISSVKTVQIRYSPKEFKKMSLDTLPIEQSVELNLQYPSVSDRYFKHYYFMPKNPYKKTKVEPNTSYSENMGLEVDESQFVDFLPKGEDTCIMMHSNRICVVTLSLKHPIIFQKKTITKVDFCSSGIDRLSNKVSGKGKRGAQIVGAFSVLCNLECNDGSSYLVLIGMQGKLIEVNERLVDNPNLICTDPRGEGYLAVVLPKFGKSGSLKNFLLSHQEYEDIYVKYPL